MTDVAIEAAGVETRQAMLRVWMAISAVWVVFWLSMAGIIVLTGSIENPLFESLSLFVAIVITPPVILLAIGAVTRLLFEALAARFRTS
jgi:hypothetical protein